MKLEEAIEAQRASVNRFEALQRQVEEAAKVIIQLRLDAREASIAENNKLSDMLQQQLEAR